MKDALHGVFHMILNLILSCHYIWPLRLIGGGGFLILLLNVQISPGTDCSYELQYTHNMISILSVHSTDD